jgi:hypothetical protein
MVNKFTNFPETSSCPTLGNNIFRENANESWQLFLLIKYSVKVTQPAQALHQLRITFNINGRIYGLATTLVQHIVHHLFELTIERRQKVWLSALDIL